MLKEFRAFLLRGNLLELAVAFVMAAAFVKVVTALVEDLIQPIIAAIFGTPNFNDKTFTIGKGVFMWGAFVTEVIVFVSHGRSRLLPDREAVPDHPRPQCARATPTSRRSSRPRRSCC